MRIAREDYPRLRLPVAAGLALAILGASCLVAANYYLAAAKSARESAKAGRIQAQTRVERVAEEEREIHKNLTHYRKMLDRGMVGQENRLDLIDAISRIKKERRLFEIKYSIEPQKPLDYAGISAAGQFDFLASRMKLDMLILHEEDLVNFLVDLDKSGKSHVSVRDCSITRIDRSAVPLTSSSPRLRSECQIDLIVLRQVQS